MGYHQINSSSYHRLKGLFSNYEIKTLQASDLIYTPEKTPKYIFYLVSGAVRLFEYNDGVKKTRDIFYKDEIFGTEGFFNDPTYLYFTEPLTNNISLYIMPIDDFTDKIKKDAGVCFEFFKYQEEERRKWVKQFSNKFKVSSENNIILYLEQLARKIGVRVGFEILIPIMSTHEDIAGILGVSRQTVSQTLYKLKKEKAIYYNRKRMIIRDEYGKITR